MLVGYDRLAKTFKRLIKEDRLSHSYIFFGEPEIGKFSFALFLASYLETGKFEEPLRPLTETFIIRPDEEGTISINTAREAKYFLLKKPVNSSRRIIIIDEAEKLTTQAQQAILKMTEEPPPTTLIFLILSNPEGLLPTIQSRFQKIYFPRINPALIVKLLVDKLNLSKTEAVKIAEISFGRPGRAIRLAEDQAFQLRRRRIILLQKNNEKRQLIEELVKDGSNLEIFFTDLIAELAREPIKNYEVLKSILNRLTKISQFTTNKRLQLEAALWNI